MLQPLIKPKRSDQTRHIELEICVPFVSTWKLAEIWCASSTNERELEQSEDSIRNYVYLGHIPSFHIGKRLVVNITRQAHLDAASLPFPIQITHRLQCPSLPIDAFATYTGFTRGVIEGWIKNGYIPSVGMGKHRMITLPELLLRCEQWSPDDWSALVRKSNSKQSVEA
jgi:hypothetical protein